VPLQWSKIQRRKNLRLRADQTLRQLVWLDQEEPMEIAGGPLPGDGLEYRAGRHNVEHGQPRDPLGKVERHAMRHATAAVVAHYR